MDVTGLINMMAQYWEYSLIETPLYIAGDLSTSVVQKSAACLGCLPSKIDYICPGFLTEIFLQDSVCRITS